MNLKVPEVDQWFDSLTKEALDRNNKSVCTWTKYKDDLEETKSILTWLPQKLKHQVMVPIGPKALMRGELVHTNELLVNLGETWFAKRTANQTIDICNRRIEKCNEMLNQLEKERELITNKKSLPIEQDAFGSEERPEIIEHITEEEDLEWRKQHRIKEKEYHQKLAELKSKDKKEIKTEEDLWNHLDELELQEELEDELNRLNAEDSSEDEEIEYSNESQTSNVEVAEDTKIPESSNDSLGNINKPKRKVSFVPEVDDSSDEEPLRLIIKHSSVQPESTHVNEGAINSPADIYNKYIEDIKMNPISVLKSKINPNKEIELEAVERADYFNEEEDEFPNEDKEITSGIMFSDVVERNISEQEDKKIVIEPPRKMSKFKASRLKK